MYGPPPDPRETLLSVGPADQPVAWALTLVVGLLCLWMARSAAREHRNPWVVAGLTVLLTVPALGLVPDAVLGRFPTVDKEGSLLFYLDGVHIRQLLHPLAAGSDPASRLIGVHTGHLWVTQAFDLVLPAHGAMNAQGLMNLGLGWGCMALLCRTAGASPPLALALGLPFGLGLHVVRDLNWYTIEKSSVFWLPLFAWTWLRAWQAAPTPRAHQLAVASGLVYGLMTWMNLYFGLVAALLGALALSAEGVASLRARRLREQTRVLGVAGVACAVPGLLLAAWQTQVMASGPVLATPDQFLWERAALDSLVLWPPSWNRLEPWRALNPAAVGLVAWGAWRGRHRPEVQFCAGAGLLCALVALGPVLWWRGPLPQEGVPNPLFLSLWAGVPGFDRVAKPEVFFEATWMLALAAGACGLQGHKSRRPYLALAAVVLAWIALVRTHPVYPPFAAFQSNTLDPDWAERAFPAAPTRP